MKTFERQRGKVQFSLHYLLVVRERQAERDLVVEQRAQIGRVKHGEVLDRQLAVGLDFADDHGLR